MFKQLFDKLSSLSIIFILSPLMIVVSILIKLDSSGPVLFVQRRVGINNEEFLMYKFRTMFVGTPNVATDKLTDSQNYVTKIGYYLRKYSIDELPQLFNIFLGQMSVVGPRPALYNQYDLRKMRNQLGISKIRPGLTGWAQVNGRDDVSLQEKVNMDLFYLNKQSFLMDLKIIYKTIFSISAGNGVSIDKRSINSNKI